MKLNMAPNSVRRRMAHIYYIVMATKSMVQTLVLLTGFFSLQACAQSPKPTPMSCSSAFLKTSCEAYLYFSNSNSQNLYTIATNFNVDLSAIFFPEQRRNNAYLIQKHCSCGGFSGSTTSAFLTNVEYNSPGRPQDYFGSLFYQELPTGNVKLICGCPIQGWNTTITYIVETGDDLKTVSEEFGSDAGSIKDLNSLLDNGSILPAGSDLFIPTQFKPYSIATQESSPPSPSTRNSSGLVAGVISGVVVLIILAIITGCVYWWRRSKVHGMLPRSIVEHSDVISLSGPSKDSPGRFGVIGTWFNSQFPNSCPVNSNVKRSITLPREAMDVFDQEKPIIFAYEEIIEATENFKESRLVGQGSYGAVYYGILREQNVAIKQMKTTKSREFYAELKVLCKVHHTNLVELLGYSAGDDSLFLIYEFAENGPLSQHLHCTTGYLPLSWTTRVQIALDTARGLEYIHDHTKAHYVHRDVKTSNILLDGFFRAKVADFGLAKLVQQNSQTFVTTTTVAGTVGYMPPEYMLTGHTTSKSDVYAFGVVLFELITGKQAMSKTNSGRRSLISFMLEVLKEEHNPRLRFQDVVDPRLKKSFPLEWSFKMAKLARACVDEEPANRPDMRTVVFTLSQFLLNSVEWEASLGGTSQIFSGLTQGR